MSWSNRDYDSSDYSGLTEDQAGILAPPQDPYLMTPYGAKTKDCVRRWHQGLLLLDLSVSQPPQPAVTFLGQKCANRGYRVDTINLFIAPPVILN